MKIIILSDGWATLAKGGAERIASQLASDFVNMGHNITVITTAQTNEKIINLSDSLNHNLGIKIHYLQANYPIYLRPYISLYNPQTVSDVNCLLKNIRPDLVYAHNVHHYLSYRTLTLASNLNIPVVLTLHDAMTINYDRFYQGISMEDLSTIPKINYQISSYCKTWSFKDRYLVLRNSIIRRILYKSTQVRVAVSQELRKLLEINDLQCTHTIHNGVNPKEWELSQDKVEEFRQRLNLQGEKIILFGGRISFRKGGEHIVRALPDIIKTVPNSTLLVIGSAEGYALAMLKIARRLGVENKLAFTDWLSGSELIAAYHLSNVVVVPSIYLDPFPTVTLEAMAAHKPVVVTCFGGASEAVIEGKTGYIINPLNTEEMAKRITYLLKDEQMARKIGEAAYNHLQTNFTLKQSASKYMTIFEKLL